MVRMAAVVTEKSVEQAASPEALLAGRRLHASGAVSETAGAYAGAGGFVVDDTGTEFDVWVGVQNLRLVGECDCLDDAAPSASAQLCAHAVALALAAIDADISWAQAPSSQADAAPDDPAAALAALTAAEKGRLLDTLLRQRPELRPAAEELAMTLLDAPGTGHRRGADTAADAAAAQLRDETAAAVQSALQTLDINTLQAGYTPGRGYVDEYSAAAELVEQALEPYERDVARRLSLGLTDAAQAVALGVLDGLRACEGSYDGDQVLCYAGEDLQDYAHEVLSLLRKAGAPLPEDDDE
jgi:hypothetical protein